MVRVDMKPLDQRFRARIGVGIESAMGKSAAPQKALQPQHVAIAGRADDDRPAGAAFEQADAAQDQRPHDALAEIGLLHHQIAQAPRGDDDRLDRLDRLGIDQRRPVRQLRQLADEIAGAVADNSLTPAKPARLGDVDLARQDEDQPRRDRAGRHDVVAGGIGTRLAEPAHTLDIRVGEHGKHLVAAGGDGRADGRGHGANRSVRGGWFEGVCWETGRKERLVTMLSSIRATSPACAASPADHR